MADLITNNIAATAKQNPEVFFNALESSNTVKNGYLTVIPNVKNSKVLLNKLIVNAGLSQVDGRDCAWDPTTGAELASKEVSVADLKVNAEQCIDALDSLFSQEAYNATKRGEMAPSFEDLLMKRLGKAVGLDIEKYIWSASTASGDPMDGILAEAAADGETIKVTATTLNASNVLAEIEKVYNAIPQAVLDEQYADPENGLVRIFVSPKTYRFVRQALSTTPTNVNVTLPSWTIDNGVVYYLGVQVVVAQGMSDDKMIAASKQNLQLVTNLLEDAELKGDRGASLKDENIFYIKAQYKLKATYVMSDEVVLYA